MTTLAPTLAMLAAFTLAFFGAKLAWRGGPERTKGVLMLVMAVVLLGNVLIWTI
jgi:hypothetical protein